MDHPGTAPQDARMTESSTSSTRALRFHEYGEPSDVLRLEEASVPSPARGRVRAAVRACGRRPHSRSRARRHAGVVLTRQSQHTAIAARERGPENACPRRRPRAQLARECVVGRVGQPIAKKNYFR